MKINKLDTLALIAGLSCAFLSEYSGFSNYMAESSIEEHKREIKMSGSFGGGNAEDIQRNLQYLEQYPPWKTPYRIVTDMTVGLVGMFGTGLGAAFLLNGAEKRKR